jgi:two-component system chemotaxis response regulator CheY
MRLLIVDDDSKNRRLLAKMVTAFGECEAVESGKEAISAFTKAWENWRPFNIIFLDILMPEMDGREVLHKIREIEKEKNISKQHQAKILIVSGMSEKDMVLQCLEEGCDEFIVKPIEMKLLFEKINNLDLAKAN